MPVMCNLTAVSYQSKTLAPFCVKFQWQPHLW